MNTDAGRRLASKLLQTPTGFLASAPGRKSSAAVLRHLRTLGEWGRKDAQTLRDHLAICRQLDRLIPHPPY